MLHSMAASLRGPSRLSSAAPVMSRGCCSYPQTDRPLLARRWKSLLSQQAQQQTHLVCFFSSERKGGKDPPDNEEVKQEIKPEQKKAKVRDKQSGSKGTLPGLWKRFLMKSKETKEPKEEVSAVTEVETQDFRAIDAAVPVPANGNKKGDAIVPTINYYEKFREQGSRVSCTAWHRPSIDSDDVEARSENGINEGATAGTSCRKESWLVRLMFGFSKSNKPWKVPWTSFTIIQVMFLWFCTFWLVGSWIIPFAAHYIGCSKDTLTYRGQALYSLITDIAEGTVGLGILHRCLARFQPLPSNWFPFSWRGQWYIDVLLGCLTFPVVNRLSQLNLELLPFPSPLTSSYEQSIMSRDPIASILYAIVVSVCCPIWEEVIFRGFLLPSLTRYLPMWASIFVSAVVFGLAHFNVQRMLPLTFLGLVMGIMFVRSQNLLSSMLLHSLWNGFVFMGLLR